MTFEIKNKTIPCKSQIKKKNVLNLYNTFSEFGDYYYARGSTKIFEVTR